LKIIVHKELNLLELINNFVQDEIAMDIQLDVFSTTLNAQLYHHGGKLQYCCILLACCIE
jgi:hypothetical protein